MFDEVQNTDEDVDALYDRIMGEGDQETPGTTTQEPPQTASVAPPAPSIDFEFIHNGKQIKANREAVLKWAQQGYDYSQKMADFNKRLTDVDAKYSQVEELKKTYGPVDEWVSQNPDKWDALQRAIQGVEASGENPQLLHKLKSLESEVAEASKFIKSVKEEREAELKTKEDTALDTEIKSIQEKYKDLDWKTVDQTGAMLEHKVIDHAMKNGINSFKAAFHDLMHDDLIKLAEAKGRENLGKERQIKNGVIGTTSQPTKNAVPVKSKKGVYDSTEDILKEFGIMQ